MEARATFVVEVIGELRESVELMTVRVAEALSLDEAKARVLVERMPGVITKPMSETRAAKVALRLQAAGLAAVPRSAHAAAHEHGGSPYGPLHRAGDLHAPTPPFDVEPFHAPPVHTPPTATPTPPPPARAPAPRAVVSDAPPAADEEHEDVGEAHSPLANIPSVDATLIEERDVRDDPKLTAMSAAGFGAADIVVPIMPQREWPAPRERRFSTPIVEGGAVAKPDAPPAEEDVGLAWDDGQDLDPAEDAAVTMIRPAAAEPEDATPRYARSQPTAPERGAVPRPPLGDAPGRDAPAKGAPLREAVQNAPVRDRDVGIAASSRARDTIARDRAVSGAQQGERERPPTLGDDEIGLTPPPDRTYRSTRSAAESMLTLTPPPDAVLKRSGVRDEALPAVFARRRGAFGRRLSGLVVIPMACAWALGAWFVWLLLPTASRAELWVPLVAATGVAALFGALFAGLATSRIAHDVSQLRDAGERIAMGDLAQPVEVRRRDEIGDIAAAVERMRVSLQESLDRLRRRNR
jgi:HAMP domain-containing protein